MYDLIHPKTGKVTGQLDARARSGSGSSTAPGRPASRASSSSTRPTTTTRCRTSAPTRPPTRAASSRCCRTTSATWARSTSARSFGTAIDWDSLRRVVHLSTHFLENVIDANQYPLPEITDLAQRIRRIGLGVMGLADVFVKLGIPYDSEEGVELGRKIQQFVDDEAKVESERLAGSAASSPSGSGASGVRTRPAARDAKGERIRPMRRLRNCNVTTVAPTGTISIIAGCSSGIEPLFAVAFMRNQAGVLMPDVNEDFVAIAKREGWYSDDLMRRIAETGAHRLSRGAGQVAAGLRHRQRHQARVAHPDAGGIPGVQRQRHLQDLQLRPRCHRGVRRGDLPPGLPAQLQGRHGLPRRQPRHAGALDRLHREEGEGGGRGHAASRGPGGTGLGRHRRRAPATADLRGRARRSCERRTSGCSASCTSSRPRISSAGRSAPGPRCSAAPPGGSRLRSARSTSPSPRTTRASRSRSS